VPTYVPPLTTAEAVQLIEKAKQTADCSSLSARILAVFSSFKSLNGSFLLKVCFMAGRECLMCVCVFSRAYMCVCVRTCVYVCVVEVCTSCCVCMCTCTCVYVCLRISMRLSLSLSLSLEHSRTLSNAHTHTHSQTHIRTHTLSCSRTLIHSFTRTLTLTPSPSRSLAHTHALTLSCRNSWFVAKLLPNTTVAWTLNPYIDFMRQFWHWFVVDSLFVVVSRHMYGCDVLNCVCVCVWPFVYT
jgi:hypothetical protein